MPTSRLRAALVSEPDKLAGGIGFGPRLMMSEAALRTTGLLQPGSLVHWIYRLRLADNDASDAAAKAVTTEARARFPQAGWDIRYRSNASPQLERNVERFTQFLTIVGLTALLVGGVGVGNAVKSHLDRKRDTIATMKALGATGSRVFAIYLTQVMLLALHRRRHRRSLLGAGSAIPRSPGPSAPSFRCRSSRRCIPATLVLALVYGLLTALAFALWPLGRAHDVAVGELFRAAVAPQPRWPRKPYIAATAAAVAMLATLAVLLAYDRRVAAIYVGVAAAVFILLRLVAGLLMCGGAPRAAVRAHRLAHGHRQYPPAGRADADGGALARPGHCLAGDGDRDRRQSARTVHRGAAGEGAVVLFPRHPRQRGHALRCLCACAGAGGNT